MFVKGQKVICKEDNGFYNIRKNWIYKVSSSYPFQGVMIKNDVGEYVLYPNKNFKTVIQSLDDVIVGMELTHITGGKCKVISKGLHIRVEFQNHGWVWRDISKFKEYKPKEKDMYKEEYEVIKPFNLLELWREFKDSHSCREFQEKWEQVLYEVTFSGRNLKTRFDTYNSIKKYNALYDNLPHLEKKGFVERVERNVVLIPGMELTNNGVTYKVIESGDGARWNKISLFCEGHAQNPVGFIFGMGRVFKYGTTLKELNEKSLNAFEVVENGA